MPYERLVGLNVVDETRYAEYRAAMTPLLHAVGGSFRYDFRPAEVLKSEAPHPITRVFVIRFPDQATHERFFADPQYLAVRRDHFEPSVRGVTTLAAYEC
jgi:uncharacterized protein (DUF1330 family)